jgi:hypothetical protein
MLLTDYKTQDTVHLATVLKQLTIAVAESKPQFNYFYKTKIKARTLNSLQHLSIEVIRVVASSTVKKKKKRKFQ